MVLGGGAPPRSLAKIVKQTNNKQQQKTHKNKLDQQHKQTTKIHTGENNKNSNSNNNKQNNKNATTQQKQKQQTNKQTNKLTN